MSFFSEIEERMSMEGTVINLFVIENSTVNIQQSTRATGDGLGVNLNHSAPPPYNARPTPPHHPPQGRQEDYRHFNSHPSTNLPRDNFQRPQLELFENSRRPAESVASWVNQHRTRFPPSFQTQSGSSLSTPIMSNGRRDACVNSQPSSTTPSGVNRFDFSNASNVSVTMNLVQPRRGCGDNAGHDHNVINSHNHGLNPGWNFYGRPQNWCDGLVAGGENGLLEPLYSSRPSNGYSTSSSFGSSATVPQVSGSGGRLSPPERWQRRQPQHCSETRGFRGCSCSDETISSSSTELAGPSVSSRNSSNSSSVDWAE